MVISIGRQFGSGGRMIAKILAERLDFKFYDKELLTLTAKNSGFDEMVIQEFDEKPTSALMFDTGSFSGSAGRDILPLSQKLAFAQFDAIRQVAEKGSCVIVGRCADYILRQMEDMTSIFIHAPFEFRRKMLQAYGEDSERAGKKAAKVDKKRASYYSFYTQKKWGDVSSYHLSIDSSLLGIDGTAETLYRFMLIRIEQSTVNC